MDLLNQVAIRIKLLKLSKEISDQAKQKELNNIDDGTDHA